jgi:LuxR family transcriptional regulator
MLATLERMIEADTIKEVWALYLDWVSRFGFDRVMYGFTPYWPSASFEDVENLLFLSNHDQAYLDGFIGKKLYRDAPMVRWASENVGAASWREVAEAFAAGRLTPGERKVIEFNRSMGVVAGYSISFKDVSVRAKGAVGLAARRDMTQDKVDAIWDEHGRYLLIVSTLLHLKMSTLPRLVGTPLTLRQREALEWVADGKTTQDIALLMGISTAMVEKHLRLAREALDVETTAHAVAKASRLNQIFVVAG